MEFAKFVEWAFYGIIGGCAIYIASALSSMKDSIAELTTKIAVVLEKTLTHEKRLDRHDEQIEQIRDKQ